jgi:hypothetical protein
LQGDTLAPFLFVLLLDCILRKALRVPFGVPLNGHPAATPRSTNLAPLCATESAPYFGTSVSLPHRVGGPRVTRQSTAVHGLDDETAAAWATTPSALRSSSTALQRPKVVTRLSDLDFADDLVVPTYSIPNAQHQLHGIQRVARQCGLELNVGKGKTEYMFFRGADDDELPPPMVDLGGKTVQCVQSYGYLGLQPANVLAAFNKRKGLAWVAIVKLGQLWTHHIPSDIKLSLFKTLVESVLVYGCQAWPDTAVWRRRIDSTYDMMIRHCLGPAFNKLALHQNGKIPLLSSLVAQRRFNTIGHALRRDQALTQLLTHDPSRIGRSLGVERVIKRDIHKFCLQHGLHTDRDQWVDAAHHHSAWRRWAREMAAANEDSVYARLQLHHDRRVAHPQRQQRVDARVKHLQKHAPYLLNLPPPTGPRINFFRPSAASK